MYMSRRRRRKEQDEGVGEEGELLDEYQENEVDSDSNMDTLRDRLDSVNEIDEEMKEYMNNDHDDLQLY